MAKNTGPAYFVKGIHIEVVGSLKKYFDEKILPRYNSHSAYFKREPSQIVKNENDRNDIDKIGTINAIPNLKESGIISFLVGFSDAYTDDENDIALMISYRSRPGEVQILPGALKRKIPILKKKYVFNKRNLKKIGLEVSEKLKVNYNLFHM